MDGASGKIEIPINGVRSSGEACGAETPIRLL